jgi:hypothetical protein
MTSQQQPTVRWKRMRLLGRLGVAVAAGGAFAALSWNSPPKPEEEIEGIAVQQDSRAAERQSAVTEDDALPQLKAHGAADHRDAQSGLSQAQARPQAEPVDGLRSDITTGGSFKVFEPTDEKEIITTKTGAVPHSRSPP